jgi:hypothetical protein
VTDGGLHRNEKYTGEELYEENPSRRKKSTPFSLWRYDDPKQYPDGNADVAAYWAEDQIFCGIILFDRGERGTEVGLLSPFTSDNFQGTASHRTIQLMTH